MNPQLEFFLEQAFESVTPTSPGIGRVVVEPDYEVSPADRDAGGLAQQLRELLDGQSPDAAALASSQGYEVAVPREKPLLRKYLRSITLHRDRVEGAWVEVAPPGNWI
jgi:hypothetical protein